MKKILISFILLFMPAFCFSSVAPLFSVKDLVFECNNQNNLFLSTNCYYYLKGINDGLTISEDLQFISNFPNIITYQADPPDITFQETAQLLVAFYKDYQKEIKNNIDKIKFDYQDSSVFLANFLVAQKWVKYEKNSYYHAYTPTLADTPTSPKKEKKWYNLF